MDAGSVTVNDILCNFRPYSHDNNLKFFLIKQADTNSLRAGRGPDFPSVQQAAFQCQQPKATASEGRRGGAGGEVLSYQ